MESLEQVLWSWNPVPNSRIAAYSLFMFNGPVPFTHRDLQGLWDEWRRSDLAAHAVVNTRTLHPLQRYGAPTTVGYNPQWVTEREKFYNLFRQFIALNECKSEATISLIYPDGAEVSWTPEVTTNYTSNRGPHLFQVMRALRQPGDLGLAVTVQYTYKDGAHLYEVPQTRTLDSGYSEALLAAIARSALDKTADPPLLPTMTEEPLPLAVWRDFWTIFRNHSSVLRERYGSTTTPVSADYRTHQGLYQNEQTGIQEFFRRVETLDQQVTSDKLVMANFIYDAGFQYALVRLTPQLRTLSGQDEYWDWVKLPATPGTQYISSMAPANTRLVVKGLYREA
jgi:hypothetical protein